ncbi:MAG: YceI family protein [Bacteroidetes bacterium]|nr:YceI family protein [Bacteroidota bacterium]
MKTNIFIVLMVLMWGVHVTSAQTIYVIDESTISFSSSALLEDIEATTQKAVAAWNLSTDSIFLKIPMKTFNFVNSIMQEHFNENYIESGKFPYAIFKGKIFTTGDLTKDGIYNASASGLLTIHGVTRERNMTGKIQVKNGKIQVEAVFNIKCKDYDIRIPKLLMQNIAEVVTVEVSLSFIPYVKKLNN